MNQPGWEDNVSERGDDNDADGRQYAPSDTRADEGRLGDKFSQGLCLAEERKRRDKDTNEDDDDNNSSRSTSDDREGTPVFVAPLLDTLGGDDDMQVDAAAAAAAAVFASLPVPVPVPALSSSSDAEGEEDKSAGGRYFVGGSGGQKCFNCGQPGHISKECPEENSLPCFLCGGRDHQRSNCPEEVCYNCSRVGHVSRDCPQPRKRRAFEGDYCNRCQMPGHLSRDCSLSWRRYVYVREPTRAEVARADSLLSPYCYNCASDRHWGDECRNRKRPDHTIFHHPQPEYLKMTVLHCEDERTESAPASRFGLQSRKGPEPVHRPGHAHGHTRPHASRDGFQGSDRPIERDQHPFGSANRAHGHRGAGTHRPTQHRSAEVHQPTRNRDAEAHRPSQHRDAETHRPSQHRDAEAHRPTQHRGHSAHRGQSSYRGSYRRVERQS